MRATQLAAVQSPCTGRVALLLQLSAAPTMPRTDPRYLACNSIRNVICPSQQNAVALNLLNLFQVPNLANSPMRMINPHVETDQQH